LSYINIPLDEVLLTDEEELIRYAQAKRCAGGLGSWFSRKKTSIFLLNEWTKTQIAQHFSLLVNL